MKHRSIGILICGAAAGIFMIAAPLVSEITQQGRGEGAPIAWREEPVFLSVREPRRLSGGDEPVGQTELESAELESDRVTEEPVPTPETGTGAESEAGNASSASLPEEIVLLDAERGTTVMLPLEEYIVGVVAAEMPYTFQAEALKAQAVAARSYCLYKWEHSLSHEGGADVCTDHAHCAAYVTEQELVVRYGKSTAARILKKIRTAVSDTEGEVMTYQGKAVLALFHSRSFLTTESSENVWGGAYPYLVSVPTPEEDSVSTVTVSDEALRKAFTGEEAYPVSLGFSAKLTSTLNSSGRQGTLTYAGVTLTGRKVRSLLSLRSSRFEYERTENGCVFTVHGYGLGVGMSQYGANTMALAGADYREILTHYYTGAVIVSGTRAEPDEA